MIDLDRIERELSDIDHAVDVCTTWQNSAGERETEHLCTASEMLRLVRAVRAALEAEDLVSELRGYANDGWKWKYGEYWDGEQQKLTAALATFRKE